MEEKYKKLVKYDETNEVPGHATAYTLNWIIYTEIHNAGKGGGGILPEDGRVNWSLFQMNSNCHLVLRATSDRRAVQDSSYRIYNVSTIKMHINMSRAIFLPEEKLSIIYVRCITEHCDCGNTLFFPRRRFSHEQLKLAQLVKEFSTNYGTIRFIMAFGKYNWIISLSSSHSHTIFIMTISSLFTSCA
jgi:hypothetical protein